MGFGGDIPEDPGPIMKATKELYEAQKRAGKCGSKSELQCFLDKDANATLGKQLCRKLK